MKLLDRNMTFYSYDITDDLTEEIILDEREFTSPDDLFKGYLLGCSIDPRINYRRKKEFDLEPFYFEIVKEEDLGWYYYDIEYESENTHSPTNYSSDSAQRYALRKKGLDYSKILFKTVEEAIEFMADKDYQAILYNDEDYIEGKFETTGEITEKGDPKLMQRYSFCKKYGRYKCYVKLIVQEDGDDMDDCIDALDENNTTDLEVISLDEYLEL